MRPLSFTRPRVLPSPSLHFAGAFFPIPFGSEHCASAAIPKECVWLHHKNRGLEGKAGRRKVERGGNTHTHCPDEPKNPIKGESSLHACCVSPGGGSKQNQDQRKVFSNSGPHFVCTRAHRTPTKWSAPGWWGNKTEEELGRTIL